VPQTLIRLATVFAPKRHHCARANEPDDEIIP
jgi:hypothetical protein